MSYLRVDYKGEIRFVSYDSLLQSISEEQGRILVVTGNTLRSRSLWISLVDSIDVQDCFWIDQRIHTQKSKISISSPFEWVRYAGLELSSAYVHRDATLDFLLNVMARCRVKPKVLQ